jgi:hypothetical protein
MKLDLVLCLATAAYAAPIPLGAKAAVDDLRQAAPGFWQGKLLPRVRGYIARGKVRREMFDIQNKVQQVLDKHSKKVDKLKAEVNGLINMKGREGFESTRSWINWRQTYLEVNPGKVPEINEVISFAEKEVAFLEQQKNLLNKVLSDNRVSRLKGINEFLGENTTERQKDSLAQGLVRFIVRNRRMPKSLGELQNLTINLNQLKTDVRHLQNLPRMAPGEKSYDIIYTKWAEEYLYQKGFKPTNLDELIRFVQE